MADKIGEHVTVAAIFGDKPLIKPVWFYWRNRQFRIRKITYTWMDREGRARLYHFAVSDGATVYELCYNTENLMWELSALENEREM